MVANFITAFLAAILVYLFVLATAGIYAKRWMRDADDFLLAGREFGGLCNTLELSGVALAGSLLTFLPSMVLEYGLRAAVIGYVANLGAGYILYGILYGKLARDSGSQTVAEYMEIRYDAKTRMLVSVASSITMIGIAANNVQSISSMFRSVLGVPIWYITTICFFIILVFVLVSGFWGTTFTDMIQVVIGITAFFALLLYLVRHFGGISWLIEHFPSENLWNKGITGRSIKMVSPGYPSISTMFLNYMLLILWGNNYYFLRMNTCRNGKIARNTYIFTGAVMIPFILFPLVMLGAYAAAINPHAGSDMGGVLDGSAAIAAIMFEIPGWLIIVVMIGAFAITISTASTALIGVISTVWRDAYIRWAQPEITDKQMFRRQRILTVGIVLISWSICFYSGGAVKLFAFSTSWLGPVAVIMFFSVLWRRFSNRGAFAGGVTGIVILTLLNFLGGFHVFDVNSYVHTSIVGTAVTFSVGLLVSAFSKPNYYGDRFWKRDPNEGERKDVILSAWDMRVLQMIRYGTVTMAEITDFLGADCRVVKKALETLDQGGYIIRGCLLGYKFYHFDITEKGISILETLNEKEEKLLLRGISEEQYLMLAYAAVSNEKMMEYARKKGYGSLKISAIISLLDHRGYILQRGVMKRRVKLTQAGQQVVSEMKSLIPVI